MPVVLIGLKKYTKYKMRVAASTSVGESSLSEANDIFVRTPEDGKSIGCSFNKKKQMVLHAYCHLPHAAFSVWSNKHEKIHVFKVLFFFPPEPESSPQDVEVIDVTASEISLKWSPPEKPNGIIVAYEVLYKNIDALFMKNTSTTSIILRDLKPYTLYNISVRSYTRFGHGNQLSLLSVRTSETGKFLFV